MDFNEIPKYILDFFFPISCIGCGKENSHCCDRCFSTIERNNNIGGQLIAAAEIREISLLSKLIHRFKYDGAHEIGNKLVTLFNEHLLQNMQKVILIPVPLHKRREHFRGFNQSAVLANEISKKWHLSVNELLERHRFTQPQVELGKEKRLTNLAGAFSLKNRLASLDPAQTYILVDDVYTTGATIGECTKVLRQNGAKKVYGLVVGKAV